jgi:hypothetical protein
MQRKHREHCKEKKEDVINHDLVSCIFFEIPFPAILYRIWRQNAREEWRNIIKKSDRQAAAVLSCRFLL